MGLTMRDLQKAFAKGAATLAVMSLCGCAGVHQARNTEATGFLRDYSQLQPGSGDQAMLTYVNPQASFSQYDRILLEPVRIYPGQKDSSLQDMSPEDLQKLVNYLDATLRSHLEARYLFVAEPAPGTMRFRVAITEATSGKVAIDTISTVVPVGLALSALKSVATGSGTGVGSVGVEFEALDAMTGERLAASVDKQIGDKVTGKFDKFDKWRATKDAFDYWAEKLNTRLSEMSNAR